VDTGNKQQLKPNPFVHETQQTLEIVEEHCQSIKKGVTFHGPSFLNKPLRKPGIEAGKVKRT